MPSGFWCRLVRRLQNTFNQASFDDLALMHDDHVVGQRGYGRDVVADDRKVTLSWLWSSRMRSMIDIRTTVSNPEVTSSQMMICGLAAIARARLMRCFCPPDSSCGRRELRLPGQLDHLQKFSDLATAFFSGEPLKIFNRPPQDLFDRVRRIQCSVRHLENHLDAPKLIRLRCRTDGFSSLPSNGFPCF